MSEPPHAEQDVATEQFHLDLDKRVEKIVSIYVSQDNLTIYENPWVVQSTSNNMQDTVRSQLPVVPSVPVRVEHTASFRAAVCLGLMCFLLLTGIIGYTVQFNKDRNDLREETINLKKDRERLNATNYNLSKEMEELHDLFGTVRNWRCLGNSCYRVSSRMKKWKGARGKCNKDHSHLLVINSNEEQKFILKLIPKEMGPVWIGLSTNDNGEWQWVDGTPLSPQPNMFQDDWQSDIEETSGMDRRCAVVSHDDQDGWNVSPCDDKMFWMCESERMNSDKP